MKKNLFTSFNVIHLQFLIFGTMRILLYSLILLVNTQLHCQNVFFDSIKKVYKNSENFRKTVELSQEPSTISGTKFSDYHSGIKKAYLFNGDFQLGITIGGENYVSGKNRAWFHSLQLIPSARIRIFQNDPKWSDKSKAVRTPSFNPKIYYYITNQYFWNKKRKMYLGTGLGHHSNGQDGTEFVDFTDTVNIYNGSFSESLINYFVIGGNKNYKHLFKEKSLNQIKDTFETEIKLVWKTGFEYHPPYFSNQKFYQTGVYGGNRILGNLQLMSSKTFVKNKNRKDKTKKLGEKETHRLSLNFEYITDLSCIFCSSSLLWI
ncbi:MAG: hypothetical protein V4622_10785 [Bacteroidota bacterium]